MKYFLNIILFTGIALLPMYFTESGRIQVSHFVLAIYIFLYVFLYGFKSSIFNNILIVLFVIIFTRESIAILVNGLPVTALMPSVYLLFNIFIVNVFSRLAIVNKNIIVIKWAVTWALFVAIGGVLVYGYGFKIDTDGGRSIGTFNNPNQLGYFSVCIMSIGFVLRLSSCISIKHLLIIIIGSLFLVIASLSKAAMLSVFFPIAISGFIYSRTNRRKLVSGLILFCLITTGVIGLYFKGSFNDYLFLHRLQNIGSQADDTLEKRGYKVIFESNAIEIIVGMGGTKVNESVGHEVHSTLFSYFPSYGIIGGGIIVFAMIIWSIYIVRAFNIIGLLMIVLPSMLYGVTHNGSRFTVFWILVSLSLGLALQHVDMQSKGRILR